jgi:hypothetical protein
MKQRMDIDVVLEFLQYLDQMLHWTLEDLPYEALSWQPDQQANHIAATVWHVSRSLDLFKVRLIEDRDVSQELWFLNGWADRTGYDPRGLGGNELGNLYGYTVEQMLAVPVLPVEQLLEYLHQTWQAFDTHLRGMPAEDLYLLAPGLPPPTEPGYEPGTIYWCVRNLILDGLQHLGEVRAIKSMWMHKQMDKLAP